MKTVQIKILKKRCSDGYVYIDQVHPSRVIVEKSILTGKRILVAYVPEELYSCYEYGDEDAPSSLLPCHFGGFRQVTLDYLITPM